MDPIPVAAEVGGEGRGRERRRFIAIALQFDREPLRSLDELSDAEG